MKNMKADNILLLDMDKRGVATLTLNRPEIHNAFDDELINQLIGQLQRLEKSHDSRLIVLRSKGNSFSAGADLSWMRRMANFSESQNEADALQLARLMQMLNTFSKPTMAVVQGAAYGGAIGLIACCDIAVGSVDAKFALSEVKLGLIPAVISPYVLKTIGERAARRYFLTAEVFDAKQAASMGLLHEVVESSNLESTIEGLVSQLLVAGLKAQVAAKELISDVAGKLINDDLINETVTAISNIRASDEGKEGLDAFLQKRPPDWVRDT